jgi:hypothetical protein
MQKPHFNTDRLKAQAEDNPLVVAGIGVAILSGFTKLMNANTARKNSATWRREVKRREGTSKKK